MHIRPGPLRFELTDGTRCLAYLRSEFNLAQATELSSQSQSIGWACLVALATLSSTGLRGQDESAANLRLLLPDGGAIEAAKARVSIRGPNFSSSFSRRLNEASGLQISLADRDDVVLHIEVVANHGGGRLLGTHTIQLDAQGRWRKALDGVRLKAPVIGLEGTVRTPDDKPVAGVRIEV